MSRLAIYTVLLWTESVCILCQSSHNARSISMTDKSMEAKATLLEVKIACLSLSEEVASATQDARSEGGGQQESGTHDRLSLKKVSRCPGNSGASHEKDGERAVRMTGRTAGVAGHVTQDTIVRGVVRPYCQNEHQVQSDTYAVNGRLKLHSVMVFEFLPNFFDKYISLIIIP